MALIKSDIDSLVARVVGKSHIAGAVLYVSSGTGSIDVISSGGNFTPDSKYYIASINKMFMSSLILKLATAGILRLEDKLAEYVSAEIIENLHVYKDTDYSREITLIHLISQTSGLPDYIEDKQENGKIVIKELEAGIDQAWPVEKVIEAAKLMNPHFPPGTPGKAKYIDTNHQILELVVEKVMGEPVEKVLCNLFQELGMSNTYVCEDVQDKSYVPIRFKDKERDLSQFLTSTKNDIISTASDQMTFIKAFFNGHFYPKDKLNELEKWNRIFFPFEYGIGIQKFSLPKILTLMSTSPDMIGHAGSTGAVAFYVREKNLYFTGTVNQQAKPGAIYQLMLKILKNI